MRSWLKWFAWISALESAWFLRHVAILVAILVAHLARRELLVPFQARYLIFTLVPLNASILVSAVLRSRERLACLLSSVFAISGWTVLICLTGAGQSPLLAGLWLEVIISAMLLPPLETGALTLAVAALLVALELSARPAPVAPLGLWAGLFRASLVVAVGFLTFQLSRRVTRARATSAAAETEARFQLEVLEGELKQARILGAVGERTARFAHGAKNVAHALRGFSQLIETPGLEAPLRQQALAGLGMSVDRLEELVRQTLERPGSPSAAAGRTTAPELRATIAEALVEMKEAHRGLSWSIGELDPRLPDVAVASQVVREIVLVLLENAAEATGDGGEVVVVVGVEDGMARVRVKDNGPGFDPAVGDGPFMAGHTTKANGHGFGLFLARRLVEASGGTLEVGRPSTGGASLSIRWPILPSSEARVRGSAVRA